MNIKKDVEDLVRKAVSLERDRWFSTIRLLKEQVSYRDGVTLDVLAQVMRDTYLKVNDESNSK